MKINLGGVIVEKANAEIGIQNRAFRNGDAVKEILRFVNGEIIDWEDHYFNLMASMRIYRMNIPLDFTPEFFQEQINLLAEANQSKSGKVEFFAFRNDEEDYLKASINYLISIENSENDWEFLQAENEIDVYKDYAINTAFYSLVNTYRPEENIAEIYRLENDYADIINQFVTVARHNYDPKTDLYRHACDVSKREKWADKTTGWSQHCWGRAMGWYAMACVDVLDFIPEHEAGRESVIEILNKLAAQIKRTQDPATGVWYQVIDRSGDEGNYLESSCSTMFVYTLLKALRKGYICPSYMEVAKKGYEGLLTQFIEVDDKGVVSITKGCAVAGLGGKPVYRTGDYNYYITEKIRSNDAKAVGPFNMASLEWERLFQKSSCGTACK